MVSHLNRPFADFQLGALAANTLQCPPPRSRRQRLRQRRRLRVRLQPGHLDCCGEGECAACLPACLAAARAAPQWGRPPAGDAPPAPPRSSSPPRNPSLRPPLIQPGNCQRQGLCHRLCQPEPVCRSGGRRCRRRCWRCVKGLAGLWGSCAAQHADWLWGCGAALTSRCGGGSPSVAHPAPLLAAPCSFASPPATAAARRQSRRRGCAGASPRRRARPACLPRVCARLLLQGRQLARPLRVLWRARVPVRPGEGEALVGGGQALGAQAGMQQLLPTPLCERATGSQRLSPLPCVAPAHRLSTGLRPSLHRGPGDSERQMQLRLRRQLGPRSSEVLRGRRCGCRILIAARHAPSRVGLTPPPPLHYALTTAKSQGIDTK